MISPDTLARLDPLARKAGFYLAYTLSHAEFVGVVENDPYGVRNHLLNNGYERLRLLEAAKRHPDTGDVHDTSARKVDPDNPRAQWHVHCFYTDRYGIATEVYSHYEMRPDVRRVADETWRECIQRLREHYRPGESYVEGYACEAVTELALD